MSSDAEVPTEYLHGPFDLTTYWGDGLGTLHGLSTNRKQGLLRGGV